MSSELETNLKDLVNELIQMPLLMEAAMNKCNNLDEKLHEAKTELEAFDHTLSSDITLNPEKHGFPYGSQPERFKIIARINSHPTHKALSEQINRFQILLQKANVKKVCLQMKFEALKCLLSNTRSSI